MDHGRKLEFISYVHLPSVNKTVQYRYARVIPQCRRGYYFREHGCYISALEHVRMLLLSSYVLLAMHTRNLKI